MGQFGFLNTHPMKILHPLLVGTLFVAGACSAAAQISYSGLVAFGDSLSDRGNTIGVTGHTDHDAEITGYDNNYWNAAYNTYGIAAQGRWSSGPTWIEYLNGNLLSGTAGSAPVDLVANAGMDIHTGDPLIGTSGRNFAWGGSTTDDGGGLAWINLETQVTAYIAISQAEGSHMPAISDTLHSVWSGGNDAINWVETGNTMRDTNAPMTLAQATSHSADDIHTAITELYDAGARHFLVPNLPDLGKKPNYIGTENEEKASDFVDSFNAKLADVVLTLETTYDDISITFFDAHGLFDQLLSDPESFGFDPALTADPAYVYTGGDPTSTIVDDPEIHVFWDNTHPTTQVHQLLGSYAYEAIAVPEPFAAILLPLGLAAAFLVRRRAGGRKMEF